MRPRALLSLLTVVLFVASAHAQRSPTLMRRDRAPSPEPAPVEQYRDHPRCMEVRAEPIFNGVGYNHIVVLRNRCDRSYACRVSTNVDPTPEYAITLAPGREERVATRNGSPASGFQPKAICR